MQVMRVFLQRHLARRKKNIKQIDMVSYDTDKFKQKEQRTQER